MQTLNFTRENHAKQLTKLEALAPVFEKATIKSSSGKTLLETEDFEYMIVDQKPEYFNDYTKLGIKEEAYTYYKTGNRFRKK